mgnify:FL=1
MAEKYDIRNAECVIFDMDGVIFDSESVWKRAFVIANEACGLDLTEADRQRTCGMDEKSIRRGLYSRYPAVDIDAYRDRLLCEVRKITETDGARMKNGFSEIVSAVRSAGRKLALATSSDVDRARKLFAKNGLSDTDIFDAEVFGGEVNKGKPDPEIFLEAARRAGVAPSGCIVIEDSPNGIEAAAKGGFIPIMAVDLIEATDRERAVCAFVAGGLSEIAEFLIREWGTK